MSIQYTAEQLQRKFPGPAGAPGFPRLADVLRAEGRTDEAIELCREGLRVSPGALSGYLVLGKTLMESGRLEEAQEQFEAALRLDPRCLSAMHYLARIMVRLEWSDAAAGYYRSILEVEPWDAGIRALLEASGIAEPDSSTARHKFAPIVDPPAGGEEDTYQKPEGFAGDVLEVSLNDLAEDFLPGSDGADMQIAEESLEDALSISREDSRPSPGAAATVAIPEPMPQDILKEEPLEQVSSLEEGSAPISGEDVEERLDSLFGSEDGPTASGPSPTSTWTAAPAEAEPAPENDEVTEGLPHAKTEDFTVADAPPLPEESLYRDEPADAFEETARAAFPDEAAPAGDADGEDSRVQGEDIEKRLDELFNLATGEAPAFPVAAALPVAPAPDIEEAVSLGESVPFGGDESYRDGDADAEAAGAESALAESADAQAAGVVSALAEAAGPESPVTGQDVADKLDSLFGIEPDGQAAGERAEAQVTEVRERDARIGASGATEAFLKTDLEDMEMPPVEMASPVAEAAPPAAEDEPAIPADDNFMTTVSMPPAGWSEKIDEAPLVTGEDVEAQLDKLFGLAEDGDAFKASAAPQAEAAPPDYGEGGDRTMFMPAFHEPADQSGDSGLDGNAGSGIKEGVADWLARRNEEADARAAASAREAADTQPGVSAKAAEADDPAATLEFSNPASKWDAPGDAAGDADVFGALAPEENTELSETATIEMVDGDDVAERLDRLFAAGSGEMSLFPGEGSQTAFPPGTGTAPVEPQEAQDEEAAVSGEDVSSRLSEMFEPGTGAVRADAGAPADPSQSEAARATGFAPMSDEDEGFPDEEELPPQDGQGANVATVTLAEIYFQQGLKEQALQIYRQLLEREPENESVRARIEEIEATKPEDGDRGPGTDQRRPRPGLKVPKRKK